jgi:hypothetical protein
MSNKYDFKDMEEGILNEIRFIFTLNSPPRQEDKENKRVEVVS